MYPQFKRSDVLAFKVSRVRRVLAISTINYSANLPAMSMSVPGVHIINSTHIVNGTLRCEMRRFNLANTGGASIDCCKGMPIESRQRICADEECRRERGRAHVGATPASPCAHFQPALGFPDGKRATQAEPLHGSTVERHETHRKPQSRPGQQVVLHEDPRRRGVGGVSFLF